MILSMEGQWRWCKALKWKLFKMFPKEKCNFVDCIILMVKLILQRWLYCREHLKYVWNVYCVVTNHMRDLHTTETTGHERFPSYSGHGTNYFRFVLTFSFFYKQTISFPSHLFYSMCYNSEEYRFERFWNKLQSRFAGRDACDGSKLLYNDRKYPR